MRLSLSVAGLAALISTALAQTAGFDPIFKPSEGEKVPAGSTYEITWKSNATYPGTITIKLIGGKDPNTLELKETIATGVENSLDKYAWAVSSSLGADATYGISITLDSDPKILQYSAPFQIVGGGGSSGSGNSTSSRTGGGLVTSAVRSSSRTTPRPTMSFPAGNSTETVPGTAVTATSTNTVGGGSGGSGSGGSGAGGSGSGSPSPTTRPSGANAVNVGCAALLGVFMAALAL